MTIQVDYVQSSNPIPVAGPAPPDSIQSDTPLGVGRTGIWNNHTPHPVGTYYRCTIRSPQALGTWTACPHRTTSPGKSNLRTSPSACQQGGRHERRHG